MQFLLTKTAHSSCRFILILLSLGSIEGFFSERVGFKGCLAAETGGVAERRLLYVAEPGIRDYLEYGGHGRLVFDIDHGHRFVKRIPTAGVDENKKPLNVKGVCANETTKRIYITTIKTLTALDLVTEKILWEKSYEGGCDRLALSPDGEVIYLPSLEKEHWHVVDALTGEVIKKIVTFRSLHGLEFDRSENCEHARVARRRSDVNARSRRI